MTCESATNLVEPYLDDELDASLSAQVHEHLATCPECAEAHGRLLELRRGIRAQAPYYRAPADLHDQIHAALQQADRPATGHWRSFAIAASVLLAVSLAWNLAVLRSSNANRAADNMIAAHVRSMMATHLLDVPSSDRHTVKPWFNGKLDFAPDVKDFASQGFPLLGGRLDYIDGHAAAAMVYQRRQHVINLFTWPSASSGGQADFSRNGYHAVHWDGAGMTYWVVSDLAPAELQQFVDLYRQP
jgi:anti-sigma factor RsiW